MADRKLIQELQKKFGIIGSSKEIRDLMDIVIQVAQSDISVLINGESGVGKDIFAQAIHGISNRANKKLVNVNCGAIPEGILESELFGHKKGAFTGAIEDRKGYFEIADEGTLFLDEIAEMPLTTQVKLLRVLESKEFMRIGGETVTRVNVRIIAASNKDLQHEVDAKRFRKDLFFRLKAVSLNIPPLRERREDINLLALHFLNQYSMEHNLQDYQITKEARTLLENYSWPGNIRELKNSVETAIALSRTGILDAKDFLPHMIEFSVEKENRNLPIHLKKSTEELDREMIYRALIEIKKDIMELKDYAQGNIGEIRNDGNNINIDEVIPIETLEKNAIINALRFTKGSKRKAAKLLKIGERTLYRKLKEYEIQ